MEAAFIPEVNDELDTQNFEKFEEVIFPWKEKFYKISYMLIAIYLIFCILHLFLLCDILLYSHARKFKRLQSRVLGEE